VEAQISYYKRKEENATSAMPKATQNRKKALRCPHCGKTFQRAQALGGHVRYVHADKLGLPKVATTKRKAKTGGKRPTLKDTKPPTLPVGTGGSLRGAPLLNTGAHEHLTTALEMLMQRSRQIEEELGRVETLQAEQAAIRKQIDAINAAMQVFRP
jgi:uncharacterized C2H2 Zn-finger protein